MPISIHTIRTAQPGGAPFVEVPIVGWGEVRLQRLKPHEREKFAAVLESGTGEPSLLLDLICTTAVDDAGAPLFSQPEDRALLEANHAAATILVAAAIVLNKAEMGEKGPASVTE